MSAVLADQVGEHGERLVRFDLLSIVINEDQLERSLLTHGL